VHYGWNRYQSIKGQRSRWSAILTTGFEPRQVSKPGSPKVDLGQGFRPQPTGLCLNGRPRQPVRCLFQGSGPDRTSTALGLRPPGLPFRFELSCSTGETDFMNIIHAQRKTRMRCRSRAEPFGRAHDEAWRSERRALRDVRLQISNGKVEI
jgi:hypothetical protein